LTAKKAKAWLASVRPRDEIGRLRRQLAADLLAELVTFDEKIAAIETEVRTLVRSTPTGLPKIYGVGPVITALTLGEVGDVARFADRNRFASSNGAALDDKGSVGSPAHCVNINGNRKLNHAIHMIAIT
jgi:transposase